MKYFVTNKNEGYQLHFTNQYFINQIMIYFNQCSLYGKKQVQFQYWQKFAKKRGILARCKTERQLKRLKMLINKIRQVN